MIIYLPPDDEARVLRPINGRGGFQSLLRRIQRSHNPGTHTVEVSRKDLEAILRELGRRGPKGGFQQRLGWLEPRPTLVKADLRRAPLKVKQA